MLTASIRSNRWQLAALVLVTMIASPAWAQSCGNLADDTDIARCASEELQDQLDQVLRAYDQLAETLGPRAAAALPSEQAQWLARVSRNCGIAAARDLESTVAQGLNLPGSMCLRRFAEARVLDLKARGAQARKSAAQIIASEYPAVISTWGDRLNPGGNAPLGRFAAYYLRSGTPAALVATEVVDEVSLSYPWSDFHGIKSEDFEGYWVGQFRYAKRTPVYISVDQSWSRTRVIIDRKLIYEGGSDARVPYVFPPGTHTVEVEYVNNWHTTGISVTVAEATEAVSRSELRGRLKTLAPPNTVVQYAAVYESGARDNTVVLTLAPSRTPVILVLSSYSAVRWIVDNPDKVDVRAIIHGSRSSGSRVQANFRDKGTPQLLVAQALGSYDVAPQCRCVGGHFSCTGGNLGATVESLSELLGFPVAGFSGTYSPKALAVPAIVITPEVMADARAALEKSSEERGQCRNTTRFQ